MQKNKDKHDYSEAVTNQVMSAHFGHTVHWVTVRKCNRSMYKTVVLLKCHRV